MDLLISEISNVLALLSRPMGAFITSFAAVWIALPFYRRWVLSHAWVQPIRSQEVKELKNLHSQKANTPTMGGLLLVLGLWGAALCWMPALSISFWMMTLVVWGLMAIGAYDDWLKLTKSSFRGLSGKRRLMIQFFLGITFSLLLFGPSMEWLGIPLGNHGDRLWVPSMGLLHLGGIALPLFLAIFTIPAAANAVNLTDGMDGLASGLLVITFGSFLFVATSMALPFESLPASRECAIWCAAAMGSCLAFLRLNRYPAKIFMGDTGSLPLGGLLGGCAILLRAELLLGLIGIIFVVETLSVMIQVISFQTRGKRIFRCTPIHHHFELGGVQEKSLILRFWMVGLAASLITLGCLLV